VSSGLQGWGQLLGHSFIPHCWAYLVCLPFILVVLPSLSSSAHSSRSPLSCCGWHWVMPVVSLPCLPRSWALLLSLLHPVSTPQAVARGGGRGAAPVVLIMLVGGSHSTRTTLRAYARSSGGQVLVLVVSVPLHPRTALRAGARRRGCIRRLLISPCSLFPPREQCSWR
jgi:hypothetical protein